MAWNEPGNNNRDPWNQGGGGQGGGSPPDLNELMRKLRNRWGGSGKERGGMILLVVSLLVLAWLLSGFYTVGEGEAGLVTRLGAYSHTDKPGLRWHLPPPFEHVLRKVNVGILRQMAPVQAELLTRDNKLVEAGVALQFKVVSPENYAFNLDSPDDTLALAATSALQQVVGQHSMDELVGKGDLSNKQAEIAAATKQLLQKMLDGYNSGIELSDASLKVGPPEAAVPAFADAVKAVDDARNLRNEAQAYADSRVPAARAEAARNITEAQAYRDQVIARAEGDVARFAAVLAEYRKSPQVTRKRLYLDTMAEIYARSGKVLVDVERGSPSFTVPVPQLQQPGAPAPGPEAPAAGSAPPAPPAGESNEDSARSRSRGGR
jgi:membrane protease subunit HflK